MNRQVSPGVLDEGSAAVLLVDLDRRQIVQANPAGRALTTDLPDLPVDLELWLLAAGIRSPEDTPSLPGQGAVERIAAGEPVHGEPVLVNGTLRWVTGFPQPSDDEHQTLAVFFDLYSDGTDPEMLDRAVVAAGLSFSISDPRLPDNPVVFVNPAFERTTGYRREQIVGRNCRFLQGPDTDPAAIQQIRDAIEQQKQHATITLLNYRQDGTPFWNELSLSPVYDGAGARTHVVGIQSDVSARVQAEREREQHLLAEQTARAEAERAQSRLALLAEATSQLASTLDVDECLEGLITLVVPDVADWCSVHLLDGNGSVARVVARHRDPAQADRMARIEQLQPAGLNPASRTSEVLRGGPAQLVQVDDEVLRHGIKDPELLEVYRQVGLRSAVVVPLYARRQVLGALALHVDGSGRTFDQDDLATIADLGRRAALTLDNARLYQREHDVAEQLQRSLLPKLPAIAGLDHAASYLPGSTAAQVGGDWYDLFALPDGVVGMAIGDVMGHDLAAAASMGQLRSVLQSYAWQGSSPAVVLDRLDQLVQGLNMAQLATCVYGRISLPADGRPGDVRLTNAGHLPPVLRAADGSVRRIGGEPSLLVGAALGTVRDEVQEPLESGSLLVLYTDGLVEHRGRHLEQGLIALEAAVASGPGGDAAEMVRHLLDELISGDLEDDVALLVVRVL